MANEYKCTLTEQSLQKAKDELNENPADRMDAVESFRNLIRTRAPHVTCDMGADFLLRFLRVAKFSQLEALKRLESYLGLFNIMPDWIRNIDSTDPKIHKFLDTGYYVPLGRNEKGMQVNLFNFGAFDPSMKDYSKSDMMKAMFAVMFLQIMDENTTVNGFTGLADLTDFTMKHQTFWKLEDLKKSANMMNGAMPVRWKGFYYYNHGPIFEAIFNIFRPFLKKKIKDRLILCGDNLENIYDSKIPKQLLPVEYLPDDYTGPNNGTIKKLIENVKATLKSPEVIEQIKYETGPAFQLDESKRPQDDPPLQSFRKLNVD